MVKKHAQFVVLMILLAALPATSLAQDTNTVLNNVIKAMNSQSPKTIRFTGSGSIYTAGKNVEWLKSYIRDIDLNTPSTHIQIVRQQGTPPVEQKENQDIAADSAWSRQFELWMNPYVFLKAAMAAKATTTTQTIFAQKFTVVTFTVQNKYKVSGFINDQNLIEKIQAWIDPNDTLVEATFRDYKDFHGLQFPTMIIEKQAGELALVVIVNDVTH